MSSDLDREAPPGYEWRWVQEGDHWRLATSPEVVFKRCRQRGCENPVAAALYREGKRSSWWLYCSEHMYGRRIDRGMVQVRKLVKKEGAP